MGVIPTSLDVAHARCLGGAGSVRGYCLGWMPRFCVGWHTFTTLHWRMKLSNPAPGITSFQAFNIPHFQPDDAKPHQVQSLNVDCASFVESPL